MRETPCDFGECPYNASYSEDCRYWCGLGVDEDSYEDEEEQQHVSNQHVSQNNNRNAN